MGATVRNQDSELVSCCAKVSSLDSINFLLFSIAICVLYLTNNESEQQIFTLVAASNNFGS